MMLSPDEILDAVNIPFSFVRQPVPVPGDLRGSWKSLLLLAMLDRCCRGNRSSLMRLHVLNWATRTPHNLKALLGAIRGSVDPTTVLVRFDPSLNRAMDRARGFGFVAYPKGDRVLLTPSGARMARDTADLKALALEFEALTQIGYKLSETKADEILRWYA